APSRLLPTGGLRSMPVFGRMWTTFTLAWSSAASALSSDLSSIPERRFSVHKLFVLAWVLGFGTQALGATAEIKTDRGLIIVELLADKAPRSVSHFVELAGAGFYNGLTIHRVIPGMLIQGGAPKDDET